MCFYIHPGNKEALIASEDIKVYKRLMNVQKKRKNIFCKTLIGCSPYQYFNYEQGILNEAKLEINLYGNEINSGLHAYVSYEMADNYGGMYEKIVEFIIPKGSTYYINLLNGEIVSNKMIWPFKEKSEFRKFLDFVWENLKPY
jgi:hypothetical protein